MTHLADASSVTQPRAVTLALRAQAVSTERAPGPARLGLLDLGDPRRWGDVHRRLWGRTHTQRHTHVPTRTHARGADTRVCKHACTCVNTCAHARTHADTCTCRQADTHTHTRAHTEGGATATTALCPSWPRFHSGPRDGHPLLCTGSARDFQGGACDRPAAEDAGSVA